MNPHDIFDLANKKVNEKFPNASREEKKKIADLAKSVAMAVLRNAVPAKRKTK